MALDLSFTNLAEIAQSGGGGRPVEIPLEDIIEDPDQPRRVFDAAELAQLAASIKERGVLQAISVRPKNADGKHVIIFGARRYRASNLAGRSAIRAVIEDVDAPEPYIQLIENIQRDDLKPVEIAAFVTGRLQAGDKAGAIAERLGKPKDWVSRYAAVAKMPAFLQAKLDTSPIRAVYELFQAWREHPDAVERLAREHDAFTDARARRLVQGLRAPPASNPASLQSGASSAVRSASGAEAGEGRGATALDQADGEAPTAPISRGGTDRRGAAEAPLLASRASIADHDALVAEVKRLERLVRKNPNLSAWVARYDALVTIFERDFDDPRDTLVSRRAALLLIEHSAHR